MAYGFEITNALGETVVNNLTPVYQTASGGAVIKDHDSHGSLQHLSGVSTAAAAGYSVYEVIAPAPDALMFFRLPTPGTWVAPRQTYTARSGPNAGSTVHHIYAGTRSLEVAFYRPASSIHAPATSGYGLEVYDAAGNVTFTSHGALLAAETFLLPVSEALVDVGNREWFTHPYNLPDVRNGAYHLTTIHRHSATQVQQKSLYFVGVGRPYDQWKQPAADFTVLSY